MNSRARGVQCWVAGQAAGAVMVPVPDAIAHILANLIVSMMLTFLAPPSHVSMHPRLLDLPNHHVLVPLDLTVSVHVPRALNQNGSGLWKVPRSTWESARS